MFTLTLIANAILTFYPLLYPAPVEDDVVFMTTTPMIIKADNQSPQPDPTHNKKALDYQDHYKQDN